MAFLALFTMILAGCDILPPAANPSLFVGESDAVTLRIENLSKTVVEVEAVFLAGTQEVRRTHRRLAASGTEAYEDVIPTEADTVKVTAKRPVEPKSAAADILLQEQTFHRGIDFSGSETIVFSILPEDDPAEPNPLPIVDCNHNGIADANEIASDPSLDCNLDGIPDDCQSLEDCNADGIPDLCQSLPDMDENGIPDVCETQGDLDGDGVVTMTDVSLFTSLLLDGQSSPSADLNGDNVVNGLDLQILVALILQHSGSPHELPTEGSYDR